jgi:hypothetical protein
MSHPRSIQLKKAKGGGGLNLITLDRNYPQECKLHSNVQTRRRKPHSWVMTSDQNSQSNLSRSGLFPPNREASAVHRRLRTRRNVPEPRKTAVGPQLCKTKIRKLFGANPKAAFGEGKPKSRAPAFFFSSLALASVWQ